jgi:uncharacterized protein with PIN domain
MLTLFRQGSACPICKEPLLAADTKIDKSVAQAIQEATTTADCGAVVRMDEVD